MPKDRSKRDGIGRRDLVKMLGAAGVTIGTLGTGVTVASASDDGKGKKHHKRKTPKDLNIGYTRKYGEWWPDTYDDIGKEVDPDKFYIKGDKRKVVICAPFPFSVTYATRKKKHKKKHEKHDKKDDKKDDEKDDKKRKKHHRNGKSHGRFKGCKKQKTVRAKKDGKHYRAKIKCPKKKEICWFRVHHPDKKDDHKHHHDHDGRDRDRDHDDRDRDHDDRDRDHDHDGRDRDRDHDDRDRDRDRDHDDRDRDRDRDHDDRDRDRDRDRDCRKKNDD
ncbi:hypothetical protein [Halocatena salina]|uniref:Uncharacterized protein n=1 Tax=Halocatena salina TaxID=2934340 RepID=A0A8U0A7C8_9EURY|nr:hypothetical protein [Halocatena salina]UPM43817.1 hypothetical protein MW046_05070 [Halocatena salina]